MGAAHEAQPCSWRCSSPPSRRSSRLFYRQFVLLKNDREPAASRRVACAARRRDWESRDPARGRQSLAIRRAKRAVVAASGGTREQQLGETGSLAALATIAGSMEDAQGRFNLRNLVDNGQVIERELDALRRLVSLLQLPEQTADLIALRMAQALPAPTGTDSANPTDAGCASATNLVRCR